MKNHVKVYIDGCIKEPCILVQNTTKKIEITFTPTENITSLTNKVKAKVYFIMLPFNGVDGTDACDNILNVESSDHGCTLMNGKDYIYQRNIFIRKEYPRVSFLLK